MDTNSLYADELEQMRHDMSELRALLSEQQIVNERLVRRAMNSEMGKERRSMIFAVLCAVVAAPVYYVMMPVWGVPLWFTLVTVAFLLSAAAASVYSARSLMKESLLTGDLIVVAKRINSYKRFSVNWLKFSIPFLVLWLIGFIYYASRGMNQEMRMGFFFGSMAGAVIGGVLGSLRLMSSRRRLDRILKQIEEVSH